MKFAELFLLAAIWGASFLFMRIAAPQFGPIPLMALRVGIATLVLAPVLRSATMRRQIRAKAWPLLVVGVSNSAVPFCLLAYAAIYVSAGFDSILNATTPLWAALIAAAGFRVSMNRHQVAGLLLGFAGVVVLVWNTLDAGVTGVPLAITSALAAALSYGFAANYSKRHLAGVQPFVVAFGSQLGASLVLWPLALFVWPRQAIPLSTWGCVAALGVVCTGFAFTLYFRLIEHVGTAFATSVTFLVPIFGVLWGVAFLGETLTQITVLGCAIILLGTALATGKLGQMLSGGFKRSRRPAD